MIRIDRVVHELSLSIVQGMSINVTGIHPRSTKTADKLLFYIANVISTMLRNSWVVWNASPKCISNPLRHLISFKKVLLGTI